MSHFHSNQPAKPQVTYHAGGPAVRASHGHDHDDTHAHGAAHPHAAAHHQAAVTTLWLAFGLTAAFGVVEAVGGWLAGSLALISDAGHMATDAAGLVVALIAQVISRRPPSHRASYGHARAEVLAAFVNALSMLVLVVWISVEAVQRLLHPAAVQGTPVMVVAALGLAVNAIVAWLLARSGGGINTRGALLHVLGDLLGSVAALIAGAVIHFTGWLPIDPLLSLIVALMILRSTWELLRQSTGVLMERVPAHLSLDRIGHALARLPGVIDVHDLHVWNMGSDRVALSAHLRVADGAGWLAILAAARHVLAHDFDIDHVTLQPSWTVPPTGRRVIAVVPASSGTGNRAVH